MLQFMITSTFQPDTCLFWKTCAANTFKQLVDASVSMLYKKNLHVGAFALVESDCLCFVISFL